MNKQTDKQTLATGANLTPALFEDFRQRLVHHCRGKGVRDHCTADAIFIVEAKRLIYGIDTDYTDNRVVIHEDREHFSPQEYWNDADEEERAELDKAAQEYGDCDFLELREDDKWEVLGELEDHTVTGWDERWEYVNAHFTREAAEAFIKRKAHDYPKGLRINVNAQLYCWEWNAIKAAIMDGRLGLVNESPASWQEVESLREALSRARDVLQIMRQHEDQPNGYKYPVSLWFPAIDAALAANAHSAEQQEQKGPDWKRRSEQGWQTAAMYRAENQELKARLEAALLDGDSLAQQLQESEELLWLAHKCFGDQKVVRSGERGASDRQQAQNRIFKWLDARRMERVAAPANPAEQQEQQPVAWGAFRFGGSRSGKLYSYCETEQQIDSYITDVHRSNDSITLRKAPLYTAPIAQTAQSEVQSLREALAMFVHMAEYRLLELGTLSPEMDKCLIKGRSALATSGQKVEK